MKSVYFVCTYDLGHDEGYDHFDGEFPTLEDAIRAADDRWSWMTAAEQARRETYVTVAQIPDEIEIGAAEALMWVFDGGQEEGDIVYRADSVVNAYGEYIRFDVAASLMDDEVREAVHAEMAPCSNQEFFDAYCISHRELFGYNWCLDVPNPIY
jgi:hypothetical protein